MSKLISNPTECGFHICHEAACSHPSKPDRTIRNWGNCKSDIEFPTDCPLQEGQPIPKTIEELIQLAKKEGLLTDIYPWSKDKATIELKNKTVDKPKRRNRQPIAKRNRKDCIHYDRNFVELTCDRYKNLLEECTGVNCGYFKTK
jgi:hypothetical protein